MGWTGIARDEHNRESLRYPSGSKLYELIKAGQIGTVKLGSSTLILVPSLRRFIDSLHS